jgi:hypothetical protein
VNCDRCGLPGGTVTTLTAMGESGVVNLGEFVFCDYCNEALKGSTFDWDGDKVRWH